MYVCVRVGACVCVCVCVWLRKRETQSHRKVGLLICPTFRYTYIYIYEDIVLISLCLQTPGSKKVHLSFFIKGLVFLRVIAVSCIT